jgi:hypothetical protein
MRSSANTAGSKNSKTPDTPVHQEAAMTAECSGSLRTISRPAITFPATMTVTLQIQKKNVIFFKF